MASIEQHGTTYRIIFRFAGRKQRIPLGIHNARQARYQLDRFEEALRLVELGTIDPPPPGTDVGLYILSKLAQ
jgi:hypothetical protein